MKLILNSNGDYQTQSDDFINFYELKCHLQGKIQGTSILINRKLLSLLPPIKNYNLAIYQWGEYQELGFPVDYDVISIEINFNDDGIIFDIGLKINVKNGNVDLALIGCCIKVTEFNFPKDFTNKKSIEEINKEENMFYFPKSYESDDYLHRYIIEKYLKNFEDWLDTLAKLSRKTICKNCVFKHKYNISRECEKDLYSKI